MGGMLSLTICGIDVFTWNSFLTMYAKSGRLADARAVFAEMPERAADTGPVWPFGIAWLEEEASFAADEIPAPEPAARPTLWARLRAWLGR